MPAKKIQSMSTEKTTVEFLLGKLGNSHRIRVRAMFGEYALYVDNKVVGLICNDQLYIKIVSASKSLEKICEQDSPFQGAKNQYVVEESQYDLLDEIIFNIAKSLPEPKKKTKK
jgi:TfoX/Sxy family transcriptional regulator of competence genes